MEEMVVLCALAFLAGLAGGGIAAALVLRCAKKHTQKLVVHYDRVTLPGSVARLASDTAPRIV